MNHNLFKLYDGIEYSGLPTSEVRNATLEILKGEV